MIREFRGFLRYRVQMAADVAELSDVKQTRGFRVVVRLD